ncbi:MAG: GGDEF domain-containing protein [Kutzneria sp.]|nr:GGDEF domain-containing protein [Kutzneria sp.]
MATDRLTGLLDRWGWEDHAPAAFARVVRNQIPAAMLVLDLDGFKQVNDDFGHVAGDVVLRATASRLRMVTLNEDLVSRYGGDEFLVLLPGATKNRAFDVARDIRREISRVSVRVPVTARQTAIVGGRTVSIGVALHLPMDNLDLFDLRLEAEAALRTAKKSGGDRVFFAGESACH